MEYPQKEAGALQEFGEFIGVRTAFWGLLGVFSVFLPFLNHRFQAIPVKAYGIDDGVFNILPPSLITVIATIVAFTAAVSIFSLRGTYRGRGQRDARSKAWTSIRVSLATLVLYLIIHKVYSMYIYPVVNISISDLRKLYFEAPLLLAYTTFFSHLTQTLMLVAMTKFYRN